MRFQDLTGPHASSSCRTTKSSSVGAILPTYTVVDLGAPPDGGLACGRAAEQDTAACQNVPCPYDFTTGSAVRHACSLAYG